MYEGDLSNIGTQTPADAMEALRNDIEGRVNTFGVSEPVVYIEGTNRLVVELPGIKNLDEAIQRIGETPFLEFQEGLTEAEIKQVKAKLPKGQEVNGNELFKPTGLTGKDLDSATVIFDQTTAQAQISLKHNKEGAKKFAEITKRNLDKPIAIFLNNQPISAPIVRNEITNGEAIISGNFTVASAKELVEYLNRGALPVPVKLVAQQTVGASLGQDSLVKSLKAGLYGLLFVALFMIAFYRLPGFVSIISLLIYIVLVLTIYKIMSVTLTLSGIAGFILSLGMAVDANVLIFARMREELAAGRTLLQAINEGFNRAWYSIRDSHVTTLLGAIILYWVTTSIVKGFALTLGIGVFTSLFTAIIVSRILLRLFIGSVTENRRWLF